MNQLGDVIQIAEVLIKFTMVVMTGLYFTFSNTIMTALKNSHNGADTMVEINKVIINPVFMGFFIISGLGAAWLAISGSGAIKVSGLVFFTGTTLVTVVKNVPLNNKLRDASDNLTRQQVWSEYLDKWLWWNHLRTVTAMLSVLLLLI